jgi:uncharacterized protein DUF1631
MNNAKEPSNVVDLGARLDPRESRVGDLLVAVRGIATQKLHALASNMFENVDDALFDLAEKAESNAAQTQYFDGMREVRKKRALVERSFLGQTTRDFADFSAGRARTEPDNAERNAFVTPELSLVGESELEESLAITSMVGKNETRMARALFAVNQRLSVICGGARTDDANNPIGPGALSQAFRQAVRELSVDVRVKLIIYKLFDRYVLSGLDELYDEVNNELARAGVLPQLRHELPGRRTDSASPRVSADGTPLPPEYQAEEGAGGDYTADIMLTLQSLFSARRGVTGQAGAGMAGTHYAGGTAGPPPSPAELLGALTLLQSQIAGTTHGVPLSQAESNAEVGHLKEQLLLQLGQLRGQPATHVASMDEDTIDLVGMLFEFILEDRNLPAEMQVLMARLQIPYLKVALIDRRMFAHRNHPARRLLDALADAGKGWSADADRDHRLYDKVKSIVDRLLQDFDDDMHIFDRLSGELQEFLDVGRKRAELAEQRVAESTRGREKLEQARRRAAREIVDRIGHRHLPALANGVLTRAWANYLVLTLLRQGDESPEFREALRFVDDFITTVQPMSDATTRQLLRNRLPFIERTLRRGLAAVAFQDGDTDQLMSQLQEFYRQQLGETRAPSPDAPAVPLPIPDSIQAIVEPELLEPEDDELGIDDDAIADNFLAQAAELRVGQWVAFADDEGNSERAKLSWISPISGRYLFVNRRGLKVADHSQVSLAAALANGRATVLESALLFDRAMDAIVEKLRQPGPDTP